MSMSHILINSWRRPLLHGTNDPDSQHEIVVAAFANLLAYLGWLRGGEIFDSNQDNLVLTLPAADGPSRVLPPSVGVVKYTLLPETKSDPPIVADVVLAFSTMSGLSSGKGALRLLSFSISNCWQTLFYSPYTSLDQPSFSSSVCNPSARANASKRRTYSLSFLQSTRPPFEGQNSFHAFLAPSRTFGGISTPSP